MKKGTYLLVTDQHRGIYFGKLVSRREGGNAVVLTEARHCFSYTASDKGKGTFSLATVGPQDGSCVGPELKNLCVRDVATETECSDVSVAAWKAATWE